MVARICGRLGRWAALAHIVALLAACATPAQRMDRMAARLGYHRDVVQGTAYAEVVYHNGAGEGGVLHVYLGGDGSPWIHRYRVAHDPTPRRPMTLALMALDKAPSIYLARPCYHGFSARPPCSPRMWTEARYSGQVVDSMAAALRRVMAGGRYRGLVLIGYSGGGTLAMLLAERFAQTRAVITVAGNLDPDAWTAYHGYSPLTGSLNPSRRPPLPRAVVQLHLAGAKDNDVPPAEIEAAAARQVNAHVVVMKGFDHSCCWRSIWARVLRGAAIGVPWAYLQGGAAR